tara:strand:- start:2077 stop:6447 length:4371 start_codon:yes stop_codon:yes gene_type:complete
MSSDEQDTQKRLVQTAMKKINDKALEDIKKRHNQIIQAKNEQEHILQEAEADFGFYINPNDPSTVVSVISGTIVSAKDPIYNNIISKGHVYSKTQINEWLNSSKAKGLIKKYGFDTEEMVDIDIDKLRSRMMSSEVDIGRMEQSWNPELSVPEPDLTPREMAEAQLERMRRGKLKPSVGSEAVERENAMKSVDRLSGEMGNNNALKPYDDGFTGEVGLSTEEMGALRKEFIDLKSWNKAYGKEVFEAMGNTPEEAVKIAQFMKRNRNFQGDLLGLDEVESPFYKYNSLIPKTNRDSAFLDGEQYPEEGIEMTEIKRTDEIGLETKEGDFMSWDEIDQRLGIGDADLGMEEAVGDASELGAMMQEEVVGDVTEQLVKQGLIDSVAGTVGSSMVAMSPYVALAGSLLETAGVAGVMISSGIMIHQLISTAIEQHKVDVKDKEYNQMYYGQMDMLKKLRNTKYATEDEKNKAYEEYYKNPNALMFIPDEGNATEGYSLKNKDDEHNIFDGGDVIDNIGKKINTGFKKIMTRSKEEEAKEKGIRDKNEIGQMHVSGHYINVKEFYTPLQKYAEVMNKQIDKINNRANLYRKWVENGNDPDGYTLGQVQHGVYHKMPKMNVGALLRSDGRTPMDKIRNWTNQHWRATGNQEHESHPVMSSLSMADPSMMTHYQEQATKDKGYNDALNAEYIRYKIAQNEGKKNVPDFGDIKSPQELETAHPPFWSRYYVKNEKRFNSNDMNKVKESMKAYTKRGGKPNWIYQKPVMSSKSRYRWDRAFEQHNGGLVLHDKKTGKVIQRGYNKEDYDKERQKLLDERKKIYKERMKQRRGLIHHIHGRDFRPVPSPEDELPDEEKDKVKPDGADKKHPKGDINPPIGPTDKNSDVTFNETKEWELGQGGVNYDPNLADHYLKLSYLTYDIPLIYGSFDEVPEEYHLEKYKFKQLVGNQNQGNPLGIFGFKYNSFGFCLYDEDEGRIVVAIEGTDAPEITHHLEKFISDVMVDLNVGMVQSGVMKFHRGMYNMAMDIYPEVMDFIREHFRQDIDTKIIFTGHSLGGGVANILSYLVAQEVDHEQIRLYTFGSPRVMDYNSSHIMDNIVKHHYRVTLENDVISYMPPRIEGMKDGYSHAGMNIQYKENGKTEEVIGRDEQIIFRSQIGAGIGLVLTMMAFVGSLRHSLEILGLGSAYTPEGSSMYVFLKNAYKNFTKLTPNMQNVAEFFSNNLGNLIRNQQLNPNSLMNIILRQREVIVNNFIESFGLNELEFRTLVTENMLRNATIEEFVVASGDYGIPEAQTIEFYNTMTQTSVDMYSIYNPSNPVSQRIYTTLFPTSHSVAFYVESLAVGKGSYDLVRKIKQVSSKPMDSHSRSNYRKAIEKGLGFYHHIGTSIKPTEKLIGDYEHLFSGQKTYKKNDDHTFTHEGMLYYPTFHKGSVYMNSIPEKYIIGLYFFEENEFMGRGEIKSLIVY